MKPTIIVSNFRNKSNDKEESTKRVIQSLNESLPNISLQNSKSENSQYAAKLNSYNASSQNNNSKLGTTKHTDASKEAFLSKNLSRNNSKILYGNEGMLRAKSYNNCNTRRKVLVIKDDFEEIDDFLLSKKNDSVSGKNCLLIISLFWFSISW